MTQAASELRRLRRLDQKTRLRALRVFWLLPLMFVALIPVAVMIRDPRLAVAYWLVAGTAVIIVGYVVSMRSRRQFNTAALPAPVWLISFAMLAGAIAVPMAASVQGWSFLQVCGSSLVVAAGMPVLAGVFRRQVPMRRRLVLCWPAGVIIAGACASYATHLWLGVPITLALGIALPALLTRRAVAR
jgi:hypothetical protein